MREADAKRIFTEIAEDGVIERGDEYSNEARGFQFEKKSKNN